MKAVALLFSLLIILLNAVPCCLEDCAEEPATEHNRQETGSADACATFLNCGSCTTFVLQQELPALSVFIPEFSSINEQKQINFRSDYFFRIWQPPKNI